MAQTETGQFERIASGIYLEGLAVDYERGIVWYSDVIAGGVHGLRADGSAVTLNAGRMWTGGVMLNDDGAVLSSGAGGIMWNDPDTGESGWLVDRIDGKPIGGVNEMVPDGTGGIYFGTIDMEAIIDGRAPGPVSICRLTTDREVVVAADGLGFTNGMMLSPDRQRLYCNETFTATSVFDVQPDLSLTNRRVLVDQVDVDGMALDADGNLWITGFRSSEITRVRADGTALPPVPTPAGAITQIRFGGTDMRDFYITAVPADGGDGLAEGRLPEAKNSFLYRSRSDVPGMPIAPARFRLR